MINREVVEGAAKPLHIYSDRRGRCRHRRLTRRCAAVNAAAASPTWCLEAERSERQPRSRLVLAGRLPPADERLSEKRAHVRNLTRGALYPVLPLRDIVVFPHMIVPLFVGREKSVRALEEVMKDDKQILLVAQKNAAQDDPTTDDIYRVGTVGTVLQLLKLPDGTVKVLVEGGQRARIARFAENDSFFQAHAEAMPRRGRRRQGDSRRWPARWSRSSSSTSSSTRRSRPRCWSRSTRSRTRASSPTRSPRTST